LQFLKSKTAAISIALVLIISMGASMLLIPTTDAHTPPWQIKSYALVEAMPHTTGLGQTVVVYAFLGNAPPPGAAETNTYRFHNYTITFTAPSGKTDVKYYETIFDTTGAQTIQFTPDEVGTYNITFVYGGQTLAVGGVDQPVGSVNLGDIYLPSTATTTLVVQQDPIYEYPASYPIPTEYWTRPIYGENPYWWKISSNWLGTGSPVSSVGVSSGTITGIGMSSLVQRYPGDAVGSLTSHIMWTKPIQSGGVVGGSNFVIEGDTYFEGSAYSQRYTNPIIVNGHLYYNPPLSFLGSNSGPTTCLDLRTGEVVWQRSDVPAISFAMIWDLQNGNQHGVWPALLCTANFARVFDADTGEQLFNVTGVPSGTIVMGPVGEQLRYVISNTSATNWNWNLALWNSTLMWGGTFFRPGTTQSGNSPSLANATGGTISTPPSTTSTSLVNASIFDSSNLQNRFSWNVSIASWRNTMTSTPTVLNAIYGDYMILRNGSYPSLTGQTNADGSLVNANYTYFKVDINPKSGTFGQALWWRTISVPMDRSITYGGLDPTVGVFVEGIKETRNFIAYNVADGSTAWGPSPSQTALDYFGNPIYPYIASQLAFGKLYSYAYGGILYCYDLKTGNLDWSYGNGNVAGNNTDSGFQAPGYYPGFIQAVGGRGLDDGVIYIAVTEHTIETPIFKGSFTRAINASNGAELWTINDYTGEFGAVSYAIADGYTNFFNGIDNQIYTLGRGPTTMTVTAPNLAATSSQPVVIAGTLTDISSGTKQDQLASRFANGVPLAADSVMGDWMGYLYQQKPLPTNFLGVTVDISVVDSNGNFRSIGTTTTDATGKYNLVWTPDISGTYQVVATFAGTNGYWPASATTAFNVMEAHPTEAPTASPAPSNADLYFVPAIAGLFVFVAIIGVVIILVLRKRP
jgi:outer membrane protein assembly factor BamB